MTWFTDAYGAIRRFMRTHWLQILLFAITLGSADVIIKYLMDTGSPDNWKLKLAVYSVELLIVCASLWGGIGLMISLVLFMINLISIHSVYGEHWLGHTLFSVAVFLGSVGEYSQRVGWREVKWIYETYQAWRSPKEQDTQLPTISQVFVDLAGLTVAQIRQQFGVTLEQANKARDLFNIGFQFTEEQMRRL